MPYNCWMVTKQKVLPDFQCSVNEKGAAEAAPFFMNRERRGTF